MGSSTVMYAVVALAAGLVCLVAGFFWGRSNLSAKVEQALEKEHASLDAREFAMRQQLEDAFAEVARLRPLAEELGRVQERLKREQSKYERMKSQFADTVSSGPEKNPGPESEIEQPVESADEAIQKLLQSLEVLNTPEGQMPPETTEPEKIELPVTQAVERSRAVSIVQTAEPRTPPMPAQVVQPPQPVQPAQAVQTPQRAPIAPVQQQPPKPASPVSRTPAQAAPSAKPASTPPAKAPQSQAPKAVPPAPAKAVSTQSSKTQPPKPGSKVDEWQEFARQLDALTGRKK